MTLASIMDSQNYDTKIRFHIAVVLDFNIDHMFKIYSLRSRIREDVEFIFYNAKLLLKDLYETIKKDIEENNEKSGDLIARIKDYILKNRSSSKIVDMTYKKLVEIITNLFGNENIEWTKLPDYNIPLECLLFFYQYKDI